MLPKTYGLSDNQRATDKPPRAAKTAPLAIYSCTKDGKRVAVVVPAPKPAKKEKEPDVLTEILRPLF